MHDRIGFSIGSVFAAVIPFFCGIVGALIANMPISIFGGHLPPPLLALMPVYFWCLVRPDLMPPWVAFAILRILAPSAFENWAFRCLWSTAEGIGALEPYGNLRL